METKINGIGTLAAAVADLEKTVKQTEERINTMQKMQEELESLLREEQWTAVSVEHTVMLLKKMLDGTEKKRTKNECEGVITLGKNDSLPFDPMFERHELYDIENVRHITVPGVVRKDSVTTVYVHSVNGGVPVHDTIEIERVDEFGTAHTFKGHGVQARDGNWYERFEWGEWETVITDMKASGERIPFEVERSL